MSKLIHVRSPHHRTSVIDSAQVVAVGDPFGVKISLSLTRVEMVTESEDVIDVPGGGLQQITGALPAGKLQKTFEFTAELRPDQAVSVMNGLALALASLTPEMKARYGLPSEIKPIEIKSPGP